MHNNVCRIFTSMRMFMFLVTILMYTLKKKYVLKLQFLAQSGFVKIGINIYILTTSLSE